MSSSARQTEPKYLWVGRLLWVVIAASFTMGAYVTTLSRDVAANTFALESTVTRIELSPITTSLGRIEQILREQDERQREMAKSLARLEAQVGDQ